MLKGVFFRTPRAVGGGRNFAVGMGLQVPSALNEITDKTNTRETEITMKLMGTKAIWKL